MTSYTCRFAAKNSYVAPLGCPAMSYVVAETRCLPKIGTLCPSTVLAPTSYCFAFSPASTHKCWLTKFRSAPVSIRTWNSRSCVSKLSFTRARILGVSRAPLGSRPSATEARTGLVPQIERPNPQRRNRNFDSFPGSQARVWSDPTYGLVARTTRP